MTRYSFWPLTVATPLSLELWHPEETGRPAIENKSGKGEDDLEKSTNNIKLDHFFMLRINRLSLGINFRYTYKLAR